MPLSIPDASSHHRGWGFKNYNYSKINPTHTWFHLSSSQHTLQKLCFTIEKPLRLQPTLLINLFNHLHLLLQLSFSRQNLEVTSFKTVSRSSGNPPSILRLLEAIIFTQKIFFILFSGQNLLKQTYQPTLRWSVNFMKKQGSKAKPNWGMKHHVNALKRQMCHCNAIRSSAPAKIHLTKKITTIILSVTSMA